ncbi:MAG: peptide ABC transporter substrate-binding protein [Candidatus Synoicihabitans palmerolidicus]|nr:peptide ABC transporter substrate-binding protein [Candidatus Synoicihabitans palmerolidicus]
MGHALHKTSSVPIAKLVTYRNDHPDELHVSPFSGTFFYAFNVIRAPFDDARVRQAFSYALDRDTLTREVSRGAELSASHFLPDGVSDYVSAVPGAQLNLVKTRQLMAEAGYPNGEGFPSVTLLYNTSENHRVMSEAVQQMWQQALGVDVRLENQEWKVYLDNMNLGNFDLCRAGYIVAPNDPSSFLKVMSTGHGFNISGWSDALFDSLLEQSLEELNPTNRSALFARMQQRMIDEMPIAPVYHYTNKYLLRPEVRHWTDNMIAEFPLREARLDP